MSIGRVPSAIELSRRVLPAQCRRGERYRDIIVYQSSSLEAAHDQPRLLSPAIVKGIISLEVRIAVRRPQKAFVTYLLIRFGHGKFDVRIVVG